MPNTNTPATGSPPIQRSRAPSNGREPPKSARNMSAPTAGVYDGKNTNANPALLNVKATPPPTPPRINTPSVNTPIALSPACASPKPKHSLFASLKVHFKPTPPATPNNNLAASSSPCPSTPTISSPAPARSKGLSASTPNDAAPRVVEPSRARVLGESVELGSPLLTRRAHALANSSRTSDVMCTPPRVEIHRAETRSAVHPLSLSSADIPPPSPADPIVSLKSSHGITMLKSPRAKDYLLAQLATKPASPLTRSKSPPPRTPVDSPACASPNTLRKLSEPLPVQYDHLQRDMLKGSCDSISMPYNVTHTTHVDLKNMKMIEGNNVIVINNSIPQYEKVGYLHKLAGSAFKERWVECRKSTLSYYSKKDSSKPRREIHLSDCEFERDKSSKRAFTLHLHHTTTKKHYYFAADDVHAYDDWVRVFHSSGAIDKDLVVMEKTLKEKEEKQEEARKARELKKQEDEYVKAKLQKRSTLRIINMNMSDCAMESCLCKLDVNEVIERDTNDEFKISVTFDDQSWTIFRSFDKVAKMYDAMTKLKFVKGMCPPRKCPSNMSENEFQQIQISKLQSLLDLLTRNRPCVLASSTPKQRFLRFIAPVGWDDIKPKDFVMPFQFDF